MEAATNQATKQPQPASGPRFGAGINAREAGKRGGQASGISRKLAKQRRLEAAIFERSRNGAALWKLAEAEARRNQALEAARIAADRTVMELDLLALDLRATIEDLSAEVDERRDEVAELEQRKQDVEAAAAASEAELVDRLRALNARDETALDRVLAALGLLERVDGDTEAA